MAFGVSRSGMKGQGMALETVFKILILIVTVMVIVGLIFTFSDQIRTQVTAFLNQILGKSQGGINLPQTIEHNSFTSSEVANYVETCYNTETSIQASDRKDTNCFVLIGNSFGDNANDVMSNISPSIRDYVTISADFTRGVVIIDFTDIGSKITVR